MNKHKLIDIAYSSLSHIEKLNTQDNTNYYGDLFCEDRFQQDYMGLPTVFTTSHVTTFRAYQRTLVMRYWVKGKHRGSVHSTSSYMLIRHV